MTEKRKTARLGSAHLRTSLALGALLFVWTAESPIIEAQEGLRITHGIASGDVTSQSAVVWARSNRPAEMVVEVATEASFADPRIVRSGATSPAHDLTAQVKVTGLDPGRRYHYRVHFEAADGGISGSEDGGFKTAPSRGTRAEVSLVISGDLGGQGYCRQPGEGYSIFVAMEALRPDFFIANGDMIYADGTCPAQGPDGWQNVPGDFPSVGSLEVDWRDSETVRQVYLDHWHYNRADPHFQSFLRSTSMYVQWDDHEVINDFGAPWPVWTWAVERQGYPNLVAHGLATLFDFHPMERHADEENRIYRSFRWGKNVELFLLDARSYRSLNVLADVAHHGKTLLGAEQLAWLKQGLLASDATWKIVSSDVPLSVPTGSRSDLYGRDAWANGTLDDYSARTGFESELLDLVRVLDGEDVSNVVFLATDVHFAATIRYYLDADGDGDRLLLYELISGPLSAVRVPTPAQLDPTLRPVVLYGEGNIFNFAHVSIEEEADGKFHLKARVIDEKGEVRFGSELDLAPQGED